MNKKKKKKLIGKALSEGGLRQVAALPYRIKDDGRIDILVITSRRTRRLIVPKGWPMEGKAHFAAAEIEADEEAGVRGEISSRAIGSFSYIKDFGEVAVPVTADVFPLEVRKVKSRWKEDCCRKRKWLPLLKAVGNLDDRELADLLRDTGGTIGAARLTES